MERPTVSDEMAEELKRRTDEEFRVPDCHVTHEARLEVILDRLDELKEQHGEDNRDDEPVNFGNREVKVNYE